MSRFIQMYCGTGKGKSAAALGWGVRCACEGKNVFVVSFLKGKNSSSQEFLKKLEPEIKLFCFDKFSCSYNQLTEEEKQEEHIHAQSGLHFVRKVILTEECDVLILDEILDLARNGIISVKEIIPLIEQVGDNMELIMTGEERCEELWPYVDKVTQVSTLKEKTVG